MNGMKAPADTQVQVNFNKTDAKKSCNLLICSDTLTKTFNVIKTIPMGHKGQQYEKILSKNCVNREQLRSQSLPNDLDDENKNGNKEDVCDTLLTQQPLSESPPTSPSHESWFNTWPERCDKLKSTENLPEDNNMNTQLVKDEKLNSVMNGQGKISLNDALRSISLAYSPVTKQLHHFVRHEITNGLASDALDEENDLLQSINDKELIKGDKDKEIIEENDIKVCNEIKKDTFEDEHSVGKKLGHRRNEPGSFSSTISSLSEPSPSGSLLESEDRSSPISDFSCSGVKPKKKQFTNIFNKNVFSWKPNIVIPANASSVWKIFSKVSTEELVGSSPKHESVVISSAALIPNARPSNLPAKTEEEEMRHREEYEAMLAAAKKREALNTVAKQKLQKQQLQLEEQQAQSTKHFLRVVLPNWEAMRNTRKTKDLWWLGLPSSIRGRVWRLAIGNELNLTQQLYEICLARAQSRLNSPETSKCESDIDQESTVDLIQLDISRTFPNLGIFQQGGPFSDVLHSLLAAYVCYRPDVGYLQGMSYIAAILILNMEQFDAFVCFANLLNRPLHIAAFTLNQNQMQAYFNAYNEVFKNSLPKLHGHFECAGLMPDLYLLEWLYTVFAKAMPLDIACRIWDLFLRDGDEFLFRTALGILHMNQEILMKMDFLHGAQFLTRLPDDLSVEQLFRSIQIVSTNVGKQSFAQIVDRFSQMSDH